MKNTNNPPEARMVGLWLVGVFAVALSGCVTHHHHDEVYVPPPAHVETAVVVAPDYIYYPNYRVYYSRRSHQYVYRDGRAWVSRPAPPRVSANVIIASPSVRLDFRDHPSNHHSTVVRKYPKHWTPPASSHGRNRGNSNQERP